MKNITSLLLLLFVISNTSFAQTVFGISEKANEEMKEEFKKNNFNAEAQSLTNKIAIQTCKCMEARKDEIEKKNNGEEVLTTCMEKSAETFEKLSKITTDDYGVLGGVVGKQMVANGCDLFLQVALKMQASDPVTEPSSDEETLEELKKMNLKADALPVLKEFETSVCDCLTKEKEAIKVVTKAEDLNQKIQDCMLKAELNNHGMEKLAKKANTKLDADFGYKVGHLVGARLASGTCPAFLEILSNTSQLLKK